MIGKVEHQKMAGMYRKAEELIRKGWTQHTYARDTKGLPVEANDPRAACWCVFGALYEADTNRSSTAELELTRHLGQHPPNWNDAEGRTQEEVAGLLALAAEFHERNAEGVMT